MLINKLYGNFSWIWDMVQLKFSYTLVLIAATYNLTVISSKQILAIANTQNIVINKQNNAIKWPFLDQNKMQIMKYLNASQSTYLLLLHCGLSKSLEFGRHVDCALTQIRSATDGDTYLSFSFLRRVLWILICFLRQRTLF